MYLVAILGWYSRYVLAWWLSNTMDVTFCVDALDEAFCQGQPKIFNTDQGAQFTFQVFPGRLAASAIPISVDGGGGLCQYFRRASLADREV